MITIRASRGEIKIEEILRNYGMNFKEEYSFPDLVSSSGRPLRFDFAVFDDEGELDFLIEYQGIQHYEPKVNSVELKGSTDKNIMIVKNVLIANSMELL